MLILSGRSRKIGPGRSIFAPGEMGQCLNADGGDVDHTGDVKLFTVHYTTHPKDAYTYRNVQSRILPEEIIIEVGVSNLDEQIREHRHFVNSSNTAEGRAQCLAACESYARSHDLVHEPLGNGPACEMRPTQFPYGPSASCWILTSPGARRGGNGVQTEDYLKHAKLEAQSYDARAVASELQTSPWYCWPALQECLKISTGG